MEKVGQADLSVSLSHGQRPRGEQKAFQQQPHKFGVRQALHIIIHSSVHSLKTLLRLHTGHEQMHAPLHAWEWEQAAQQTPSSMHVAMHAQVAAPWAANSVSNHIVHSAA